MWNDIDMLFNRLNDIDDRINDIQEGIDCYRNSLSPDRFYVFDWVHQCWNERRAEKGIFEALSETERENMRKHNKKQWLEICYNEFMNYLPEDIT